jgi:hypothetical protein
MRDLSSGVNVFLFDFKLLCFLGDLKDGLEYVEIRCSKDFEFVELWWLLLLLRMRLVRTARETRCTTSSTVTFSKLDISSYLDVCSEHFLLRENTKSET